jgi:alpha-maltose-1-phosphate synthase
MEILTAIEQQGTVSVGEIVDRYVKNKKELAYLYRTLLYLVKFGILVIDDW